MKNSRLKITKKAFTQHGVSYNAWLVYGYAPDGTRIRKQFQDAAEAKAWASTEEVRHMNLDLTSRPVLTRLSQDQLLTAELALNRLGSANGTLLDAVEHYLKTYRPAKVRIVVKDAVERFLAAKAATGVRERTRKQLKSVLTQFSSKFGETKYLDEVTSEACMAFLRSRGTTSKTWNNYRADLHNLFEYAKTKSVGWIGTNPVADIEKRKVDGRGMPRILKLDQCAALMADAEASDGGALVPYISLALFAGLRPGPDGELYKLLRSENRDDYVDLANGVIHVQPDVSKTRDYRQIKIRPNLATWLRAYPVAALPTNFDRSLKKLRKKHALGHDVLRHTFFSMHVGAFGSVSEAALEGGNSEQICKKHYLNLSSKAESASFWEIRPKQTASRARDYLGAKTRAGSIGDIAA
jgi:hypothetical protein